MRYCLSAGLLAAAAVFAAVPANAALSIEEDRCDSVLEVDNGCVFNGNDNDVAEIMDVYNGTGKAGDPIDLFLIGKIDAPATTGAFGSITYGPGNLTGTWSLPTYVVDYISVKASNEFVLIKLTTPASSGTWSTAALESGGGGQPAISHIQFYGKLGTSGEPPVVPEPATWAMLIVGFGLVGASIRRRNGVAIVNA